MYAFLEGSTPRKRERRDISRSIIRNIPPCVLRESIGRTSIAETWAEFT
jgi:hypothetical protein